MTLLSFFHKLDQICAEGGCNNPPGKIKGDGYTSLHHPPFQGSTLPEIAK